MPYCRPTEIATEKASMTPASVEPCLPSSGHLADAVVGVLGGGHVALGAGHGEPGHGGGAPLGQAAADRAHLGTRPRPGPHFGLLLLATDSGWPTLQLSR